MQTHSYELEHFHLFDRPKSEYFVVDALGSTKLVHKQATVQRFCTIATVIFLLLLFNASNLLMAYSMPIFRTIAYSNTLSNISV